MIISETIVAIATPPGRGGVGIVRLSGPEALTIAMRISGNRPLRKLARSGEECEETRSLRTGVYTLVHEDSSTESTKQSSHAVEFPKRSNKSLQPRHAYYCEFFSVKKEIIDVGILLYFKAPHSFTGEDIIEFQGHGSPVALDALVQTCMIHGARLARPGEFSERAFLNDKIDLTQAEAIADLIHASSESAARMAVRSLQGEFSKKIHALNDALIHLRLYVEAALDFPEEEINFLNDGKIVNMLAKLLQDLQGIRAQATQGVILREGINIVIAGRPNAGKSTLINGLAGKSIAIVTDVAGTTRDVMRAHIMLDDIPVHIIDTAGIRTSEDRVEQEGIKRAWEEIRQSDCVLLLIDLAEKDTGEELENTIRQEISTDIPLLRVFNKADISGENICRENENVYLSAKSGEGLDLLKTMIKDSIGYQPLEGQFLARRRHLDALDEAWSLLCQAEIQLQAHQALELLAEDLRLAHQSICTITGEFKSDDLLGKIFSSFCIGK